MKKLKPLSVFYVAALLGFATSLPCGAQGAAPKVSAQLFPLEQQKAGVVMRLTRARWAKTEEFNYPQLEKDPAKRVLAVWYEIERPDAADKDPALMRTRLFKESAIAASSGEYRLNGRIDRGYFLYDSIDPRSRRIEIECEVPRPKAPPAANGVSEEILDFGTLPIPAPDAGPLKINEKRKTVLGTTVEIESARWQPFQTSTTTTDALGNKRTVNTEGRRIYFVTRVVPPIAPITQSTVRLEYGLVTDVTGKSLNPPPYYYSSNTKIVADGQERIELAATDDTTRRELNLKIKVREDAPSRRLEEWSPVFRFAIDPSSLPVEISPVEPPPPLAASDFAGGRVELQSVQPAGGGIAGRWWIRLWTHSPLRAAGKIPPWVWTPDIQQVQDADGNPWIYAYTSRPVYFRPDGAAIRNSEYGTDIAFQSGGKDVQPANLDIKMRLIAHRRTEASFREIPIPRVAGQVMPLRQVASDASGATLILWKIGAFDAAHPTAPTRPDSLPPAASGLALVFEYRPIPDGAKFDRATLDEPLARDDKGTMLPTGVLFGRDNQKFIFATSGGDLLKAGEEKGQWFTLLLPPPAPGVKTLSVETRVFERQAPAAAPLIEWKAVPIPKPQP